MKKNRIKKIISIFCAAFISLSPLFSLQVNAVTQGEIDKLQEELDELEEQVAAQQEVVDELTEERGFLVDRKIALDQKIELNQQQIRLIENQISLYNEVLEEKAAELEAALSTEEKQGEILRTRMRVMEENGNLTYFTFLFESDSITDLLSRIADVSDIMEHDKNLETEYAGLRENAEAIKASYEKTLAEQEALKNELDAKQAELNAQVEAAYQMIADVDELSDNAEAERAALAAKESEAEEKITKMLEELAAQQAAAAKSSGGKSGGKSGGSSAVSTSNLLWPTPSCNIITSTFGYRVQPTAGASTYHGGIDIGAQMGATIQAAAGGTVIMAEYYGGYGNCVMVDHGGGLVTLYGHMSQMAVSYGQSVSAGQTLGYVGTTGVSTGPHLHYEVRINGSQTNPAQYYSGLTFY